MFSESRMSLSSEPYNTNVTAEQPWVDSKFSVYDSDIEVRSSDGFIFQLHRVVLGVSTGAFPGSEMDTAGEIVQLTEPANVLAILFAFLYPKVHPDLRGEKFAILAAVAEAAGKYEVSSATEVCNERMVNFLPQYAPEILTHAVKHDYPRLIATTLPHFSRAPLVSVLGRLPPAYMIPWAQYHEAWRLVFKDLAQYVWDRPRTSSSHCHTNGSHRADHDICKTCADSLHNFVRHLEEIDTLASLRDALEFPKRKYPRSVLTCCRQSRDYGSGEHICAFVEDVTKLCQDRIKQLPSFATLLNLKA
ncbi:hypothetical protein GALMADRAFT_104360 [Galerina marginata CBS 339.88]|uniref:BTB domain-containing protein n=1 Tax=Galerina marginata (strain CBS 339.88) TaxID=685588 RepID=A0A067SDT6_GALM3|nr:hypothetical protein GALMADRAFT_104360 [Galerina marginata CBS 339.88]